jgi:hypothetical protein
VAETSLAGAATRVFRGSSPAGVEQGALRVSRSGGERTLEVSGRAPALAAAAMELTERRVPEIVSEQPARRFRGLEQREAAGMVRTSRLHRGRNTRFCRNDAGGSY